ncbi:TIR domain-containing protein [Streptomyces sp. NPDC094034]|uniref:TIR domain-containing protein n=1 Tax=Streptomyces sp. NPDC094034 TaxID=3155309 RepID=UPI0033292B16
MPAGQDNGPYEYDAFISYTWRPDLDMAGAVQDGLQQLAKPWAKRRALRVFRDDTHMEATDDLSSGLEATLAGSRFLVLVASPHSAKSKYVRREVRWWRAHRSSQDFLIAWVDGSLTWDDDHGDYDWERTTALPDELRGWFRAEPLTADMREFTTRREVTLRTDDRFRGRVATLASRIHGRPKDELVGRDLDELRKGRRWRRAAVATVSVVTIAALTAGALWLREGGRAERAEDVGLSRSLAKAAESRLADNATDAARFALAARAAADTPEARSALMAAVDANRYTVGHVRGPVPLPSRNLPASAPPDAGVALSDDGDLLAYGTRGEGVVTLWDTSEQRAVGTLDPRRYGSDAGVQELRFLPGSHRLLGVHDDRHTFLWDTGSRRVIHSFDCGGGFPEMAVSPDGRYFAVLDLDPPLTARDVTSSPRIWDLSSGRELPSPEPPFSAGPDIVFSPDSARLLTFDAKADDEPWPLMSYDIQQRRWSQEDAVVGGFGAALATAVGGSRLALIRDGAIELWNDAEGRRIATAKPPADGTYQSVALSADGETVVAADNAFRIYAFDARLGSRSYLGQHGEGVLDLALSHDGTLLASTAIDFSVTLWSPGTDARLLSPSGHMNVPSEVSALAVSADGHRTAVVSKGAAQVLRSEDGRRMRTFALDTPTGDPFVHRGYAALDRDGGRLAVVLGGTLRVWDVSSGRELLSQKRPIPQEAVYGSEGARFLPDGRSLLVDREDGPEVIALPTGHVRQRLPIDVLGGGFSGAEQGHTIVVAEQIRAEKTLFAVYRWSSDRLKRAETFSTPGIAYELALSDDGNRIAVANRDRQITLREMRSGALRTVLLGRQDVYSLSLPGTGDTVVVGSGDTLAMWDFASGLRLGAWDTDGHPMAEGGTSARLTPTADGDGVLAAEGQGAMANWAVDPVTWRTTLCGLGLPELTKAERERHLQGRDIGSPCP